MLLKDLNSQREGNHSVADVVPDLDRSVDHQEHGPKALQVIEQGLARSAAAGGKTEKLRPRFVPGKVIKKAITQAAPTMKTAIENIRQDKGYSQLSPENQQKLEEILQQFRLAEEEEEKLNVNPSTEQQLDLKDTEE